MQSTAKHDDETERRIDEALEESFPASDPPSFVGAGADPGRPPPGRKQPGQWGQYFGHSSYLAITEMPAEILKLQPEVVAALNELAAHRDATFQELADQAFSDLLKSTTVQPTLRRL